MNSNIPIAKEYLADNFDFSLSLDYDVEKIYLGYMNAWHNENIDNCRELIANILLKERIEEEKSYKLRIKNRCIATIRQLVLPIVRIKYPNFSLQLDYVNNYIELICLRTGKKYLIYYKSEPSDLKRIWDRIRKLAEGDMKNYTKG